MRSLKESVHRDREQNGGGQRLEAGTEGAAPVHVGESACRGEASCCKLICTHRALPTEVSTLFN